MLLLPIFYNSREEVELEDLGIEIENDFETKKILMMYFYNIDNMTPYKKNGKIYTELSSGGDLYICQYPPEQIHERIKNE
jgi:hypothetical protein